MLWKSKRAGDDGFKREENQRLRDRWTGMHYGGQRRGSRQFHKIRNYQLYGKPKSHTHIQHTHTTDTEKAHKQGVRKARSEDWGCAEVARGRGETAANESEGREYDIRVAEKSPKRETLEVTKRMNPESAAQNKNR